MKAFVDAGLPVYLNAVTEPGARAPYEEFLLGSSEEISALEELLEHGLRPSDALHLGVMKSNGISVIVSETRSSTVSSG